MAVPARHPGRRVEVGMGESCGLPAFPEPFPGTLADIRHSRRRFIDDVTCTVIDRSCDPDDFGDGRSGFRALSLTLHVAPRDNDSVTPTDRLPDPFHLLRDVFRRFDTPDFALRLLGDGMAAAAQQGQADSQPRPPARFDATAFRGKPRYPSHCPPARSSPGSNTAASSDHVSHTSWPAPPIRSRDFARFGSATETGSSRPSRYT